MSGTNDFPSTHSLAPDPRMARRPISATGCNLNAKKKDPVFLKVKVKKIDPKSVYNAAFDLERKDPDHD